ncbi:allophanate hydrolase [Paenibacillus hamazuiensis]|uniref:allophanate hydrolase n=1 Tax=Paenibacillus hamazuiensis TaxID=2936508 RepID=UPI00200C0FED|nr:allophanate hydrolase [Paenibacillus hamazuiensis]
MNENVLPRELTIVLLREMYDREEITPLEVVREIVRRAEQDAAMNIWIAPPSMDMLMPYIERLNEMDPADAPLWGIPFAVKDNIDVAGVPTTASCAEFAYTPDEHAAVVERLVAAGAIPVGKANLDQFATGLVGTRSPYGETHNSLRGELISGGSSSGSAVAVARGQAAFSLGTDTAGSGRIPAALNRLVGFKPSIGAWPVKGLVPACASLDCITVFANSLEDAATVDLVARGEHAADPRSRFVPRHEPKLPEKICLPAEPPVFFGPYADEYRKAWHAAVERLQGLGLPLEYIDGRMFDEAAAILYEGPWVAERWAAVGGFIEAHPGAAFPVTERILRSGAAPEHSAASLFRAMHKLQSFKLQAKQLLEGAVLAMPTCGGTWTREQVRQDPVATNSAMGRYTNHCNLLDLCAVAVPSDDAAHDLPFGITLFGLADSESLIWGAAGLFVKGAEIQLATPATAENAGEPAVPETTLVAVCGLHMRGYPLEKQMRECGARFVCEASTAAKYQLVRLPTTPAKPGLIKRPAGGAAVSLELWEMPLASFGRFAALIPSPLGIGKVELSDGREVPGFICEAYAAAHAEDITAAGGWRNVFPAG